MIIIPLLDLNKSKLSGKTTTLSQSGKTTKRMANELRLKKSHFRKTPNNNGQSELRFAKKQKQPLKTN